jgi:hypothetical protein
MRNFSSLGATLSGLASVAGKSSGFISAVATGRSRINLRVDECI